MTCFVCPVFGNRMCDGSCGLGCPDCPGKAIDDGGKNFGGADRVSGVADCRMSLRLRLTTDPAGALELATRTLELMDSRGIEQKSRRVVLQSVIRLDCDSCKRRGRCGIEANFRARAFFDEIVRGVPPAGCEFHDQRFYHGIDGVIDISPHPSVPGGH